MELGEGLRQRASPHVSWLDLETARAQLKQAQPQEKSFIEKSRVLPPWPPEFPNCGATPTPQNHRIWAWGAGGKGEFLSNLSPKRRKLGDWIH